MSHVFPVSNVFIFLSSRRRRCIRSHHFLIWRGPGARAQFNLRHEFKLINYFLHLDVSLALQVFQAEIVCLTAVKVGLIIDSFPNLVYGIQFMML